MGLLSAIQLSCVTKAQATAFFTPSPPDATTPPVVFYHEQLKSVDQKVNDALMRLGLAVLVVTVVASDAKNQGDGLKFGDIAVVFRVLENPTINRLGITASDCAEAIAWTFRGFKPLATSDARLALKSIALGEDPRNLAYDVFFTIEAAITETPSREVALAGVLAVTPGTGLVSAGAAGGPFSPSSKVYTLTNTGEGSLDWTAATDADWLTLSAASGTLAPSATTTVTATINDAAAALAETTWLGLVTFANANGAETTLRAVGLVVGAEGGDSMARKLGTATVTSGQSSVTITFPAAFDDVPGFADANIAPPTGQPAIGIRKITRTAAGLVIDLDTAAPASGYVINYLAILE